MRLYKVKYNRQFERDIYANDKPDAAKRLIEILDREKGYKIDLYSEQKELYITDVLSIGGEV